MKQRELVDRIAINPGVMMGKPVIEGTRIPVELILRKLGEGAVEEELLDAYPHLSHEDIQAALAYAAKALAYEETVALYSASDYFGIMKPERIRGRGSDGKSC